MKIIISMIYLTSIGFSISLATTALAASAPLHVYGPGGPLPAIKEAAAVFSKQHGVTVKVTGGPTNKWIEQAKDDADVIYSGSENMMTDFIKAMDGQIVEATVTPLYLRPSAILVRPGNPKHIHRFEDLLKPGVNVMVVQGAGQTGMWEDMAGKQGNILTVRAVRKNIKVFAPNTGEAKKTWLQNKHIDAWIVYNIWYVANPGIAKLVPVGNKYVIYRDSGVALTQRGEQNRTAHEFKSFLQSPQGARIFAKWGWMTSSLRH